VKYGEHGLRTASTTATLAPDSEMAIEDAELFHISIGPAASSTIVFIHGVLSCHIEWEHVTPYLSTDYHLLVVDANGHSNSSHILPARIPSSADRVATLIKRHAHGGKAHVVGLSMGGFIALELGRRYSELLHSIFVAGAHPYEGNFKWLAAHPRVIWFLMMGLHALPDWLYWFLASRSGMLRHEELRTEMRRNRKWETVRDVYTGALELGSEEVRRVNVRTLVVAGSLHDQVGPTRKMGPLLREGGGDTRSKAVVVENAVHAWNLQFPELFASGVRAWVEGKELPEEFKEL
jgi:pimeloyl-ACP methyl ester carboxylesterase